MQKQVGFSSGCTTNSLLSGATEFFRRSTNLRRPINRITTEYCAGLQNGRGAVSVARQIAGAGDPRRRRWSGKRAQDPPVAQPGFGGVSTGGCSPGAETGCSRNRFKRRAEKRPLPLSQILFGALSPAASHRWRLYGFMTSLPMTSPPSSIAWARPASASGRRAWTSGLMRPAAR